MRDRANKTGDGIGRREFLAGTTAILSGRPADVRPATAFGTGADIIETRVLSNDPVHYLGWPTLTRRANGDLLVVYSGGREGHVCPFGRVEMLVSHDEGRSWSYPQVLLDSPLDDRDAGVLETARGSILVTTFTSLAYEPILADAEKQPRAGNWPAERVHRWQSARDLFSPELRRSQLGQWILRSTDGGLTWSQRLPSVVNSPHGPIQLTDGRLLYAGKELWTGQGRVGACESKDDGQTWSWTGSIPCRPGDRAEAYHELHAVETAEGRVLVHIRNHNPYNDREILQTESVDGGRNWSIPRPIGVWGLPSHLLRLKDGRILMSYGFRQRPFGVQTRLSVDGGLNWSGPHVISADGSSGDLGYPSSVELRDGSLLTVWYELLAGSPRAVLRQARWRLH